MMFKRYRANAKMQKLLSNPMFLAYSKDLMRLVSGFYEDDESFRAFIEDPTSFERIKRLIEDSDVSFDDEFTIRHIAFETRLEDGIAKDDFGFQIELAKASALEPDVGYPVQELDIFGESLAEEVASLVCTNKTLNYGQRDPMLGFMLVSLDYANLTTSVTSYGLLNHAFTIYNTPYDAVEKEFMTEKFDNSNLAHQR